MVEIIDIPYIKNVYDDNPIIRKVPNYSFLDFLKTNFLLATLSYTNNAKDQRNL